MRSQSARGNVELDDVARRSGLTRARAVSMQLALAVMHARREVPRARLALRDLETARAAAAVSRRPSPRTRNANAGLESGARSRSSGESSAASRARRRRHWPRHRVLRDRRSSGSMRCATSPGDSERAEQRARLDPTRNLADHVNAWCDGDSRADAPDLLPGIGSGVVVNSSSSPKRRRWRWSLRNAALATSSARIAMPGQHQQDHHLPSDSARSEPRRIKRGQHVYMAPRARRPSDWASESGEREVVSIATAPADRIIRRSRCSAKVPT